jgi:MFS family permease
VLARLAILRIPAFRNLWLAQSTSAIGDRIVIVALALYVTELTGSATDVGIVLGAQTLPLIAFLLLGGVWADRLPRVWLMVFTDVGRAVLHGILAALIFLDAVEIWHLVVIEALFGTAEAFFRPAYTGLLPRTVPEDRIQEAQAISGVTVNLAELVGPVLATALVLGLGAGWAFALDALTFAVSAWFTLRVRADDRPPPPEARRTLLAEMAEGFSEVRSRPWIWVTIVVFALVVPLGYAPLFVLGPTIAIEEYGSAALFGVITTLFGAGALAGAILGIRWMPRRPMRAAFITAFLWPAFLIGFGALAPLAIVLPLAFGMGLCFSLFDVLWNTAMAERIRPEALSRVSSYDWMGSLVLLPVGFILAGPLAEGSSAAAVTLVGGVLTALLLGAGLIPRDTRTLTRLAGRQSG